MKTFRVIIQANGEVELLLACSSQEQADSLAEKISGDLYIGSKCFRRKEITQIADSFGWYVSETLEVDNE